jgi:Flp pilus assembly pilin Flp
MIRNAIQALRSTKAVSAAEYAILAVGIVVVVGGAATVFGPQLSSAFTAIGTKITTVQGTTGAAGGAGAGGS